MPNPRQPKMVTVPCTEKQHAMIKQRAHDKGIGMSQYIRDLITQDISGFKPLPDVPIPKHVPELDHYSCPICKGKLEETDRRDRVDTYGNNHYHSMDLQLECPKCALGMGVVLNFPYMD